MVSIVEAAPYSGHHSSLDNAPNRHSRALEGTLDVCFKGDISFHKMDLASFSFDILDDSLRGLIFKATPSNDSQVPCSKSCKA